MIGDKELKEAIRYGREQRRIEFKGPGRRDEKKFMVKVVRAVLGMANQSDGGLVVVGVDDDGHNLIPTGLSAEQLATWTYDDFASNVSSYADPYVDFELGIVNLDGNSFITIRVEPFDEIPVLCKKAYEDVLRKGALYVRTRGKIETIEVSSHVEMREVIKRSSELMARGMLASFRKFITRADETEDMRQQARAAYDSEAGDLL